MPQYEFQSTLHRNKAEMLYAMAEAWLTAGGANDDAFVADYLAGSTDEMLADECILGWGLHFGDPFDPDAPPSHMERDGYTVEDLAAAFARYRATFAEAR